jgi:hypothetical protein
MNRLIGKCELKHPAAYIKYNISPPHYILNNYNDDTTYYLRESIKTLQAQLPLHPFPHLIEYKIKQCIKDLIEHKRMLRQSWQNRVITEKTKIINYVIEKERLEKERLENECINVQKRLEYLREQERIKQEQYYLEQLGIKIKQQYNSLTYKEAFEKMSNI